MTGAQLLLRWMSSPLPLPSLFPFPSLFFFSFVVSLCVGWSGLLTAVQVDLYIGSYLHLPLTRDTTHSDNTHTHTHIRFVDVN